LLRETNAETAVQQRFILSPKIQAILEERRLRENTHTVRAYRNELKYEVQTDRRFMGNKIKGNRIHTVMMKVPESTCACQKPQLTCIPCSHILACCTQEGISSNGYVTHFYHVNELLATWALEFEPFGNSDHTRYAVKKGRRQHLRIQNEMNEENIHQTYIYGR
jgi:hypothetical protein